jgi:hypothetical protein
MLYIYSKTQALADILRSYTDTELPIVILKYLHLTAINSGCIHKYEHMQGNIILQLKI